MQIKKNPDSTVDSSALIDVPDTEEEVTPAAGDFYASIDFVSLVSLFKKSNLTYQQLSDMTGISPSTLNRFFQGKVKNPSFYNVVSIIKALGGSVDELVGIHRKITTGNESLFIPIYQQQLQERNRLIKGLVISLGAIFAFVLFILVWDITHPTMGYIQYAHAIGILKDFTGGLLGI